MISTNMRTAHFLLVDTFPLSETRMTDAPARMNGKVSLFRGCSIFSIQKRKSGDFRAFTVALSEEAYSLSDGLFKKA
jgi:hypothetical protein